MEMLSMLPVKALLRFRCVSKSWKSLIDSPEFIKMQLSHSLKTNSNRTLFLRCIRLYSTDYDSLNDTNRAVFQKRHHPLEVPNFITEIVGSCNGLLCLRNASDYLVLWNPSTGKHQKVVIPEFPRQGFSVDYIVYGFGYDCVGDDYKVVRLVHRRNLSTDEFECEVKIYSLRSNSWKRVRDFPYYLLYRMTHNGGHGILANGALHWIASRTPGSSAEADVVAAFDLGTEECRVVPQPQYSDHMSYMSLGVLGGCLSVNCKYGADYVDIWVMKEYGVKESWTNLIRLKQSDVHPKKFDHVSTVAYSKCGGRVLLLQDHGILLWYDLQKKSTSYARIKTGFERPPLELDVCLQSLVHLNGGSFSLGNVEEKRGEKEIFKKER